jgi:hypothetical protein
VQPTEAGMGVRDEFYELVAVLYHALHGAETIGMYVRDAEAAGNEQLVTFFRQAQDSQRQLAEQAREQLRALGGASGGAASGFESGELAAPGTTPSSTPGAPSATTRDVPPRAGDSPPDAARTVEGMSVEGARRPKRRPR